MDDILIQRSELIAVEASNPRGEAAHRVRTRRHAIAVDAGPYLIYGHLHVPVGAEPLAHAQMRPSMIPLTEALIEHWAHGRRQHQAIGTIVFNRDAADRMRLVAEDDLIEGLLRPE